MIRRLLPWNAYAEGWALYAEQLAAENGFEEDPFDRLGYLNAQLFRAVRLVVDTGIHRKRWSRDRAVEYMRANTGITEPEVQSEIDRYCMWSGQALGYMVGRIEILRLREKAKDQLGDDFDMRSFHDVLLLDGAMSLDLLAEKVDDWLADAADGRPSTERDS